MLSLLLALVLTGDLFGEFPRNVDQPIDGEVSVEEFIIVWYGAGW